VILVQRGVDGRNLPLAEGVVQRFVDDLRGEPEARGGGAIEHERRLAPAVLLIAAEIDDLG